MKEIDFFKILSRARFGRYLNAASHDTHRAIILYQANSRLSQELYSVLGLFEIIFRNSIDQHFISQKGFNWLANAIMPGGFLDITPGCEYSAHSVHESLRKLGKNYSHDALVARMSFGFWRYQFAAKEYAAAGNSLLQIFINRPKGINQKTIFQHLFQINDLRNRVAHYESLCFDKFSDSISTKDVEIKFRIILEMFDWLGFDFSPAFFEKNEVVKAIDCIKNL